MSDLRTRIHAACFLLVMFSLLVCPLSVSQAAGETAAIAPVPSSISLRPGETSKLEIKVEGEQNLYGVELHLKFDPSLIEMVDADPAKEGLQASPGDWLKQGFVAQNQGDNTVGTFDFAGTLLNPAEPLHGPLSLVTLEVRAKTEGAAALTLQSAILASREGEAIPYTWQDGQINISTASQAQPGGNLLLWAAAAGGLAALVLAGGGLWLVLRSTKK